MQENYQKFKSTQEVKLENPIANEFLLLFRFLEKVRRATALQHNQQVERLRQRAH